MRVLGFQKYWPKLDDETFTTFRYPRRDKDWQVGELVQIFIKPRSKERRFLGCAKITSMEIYHMEAISDEVAQRDGFVDAKGMLQWLAKTYKLSDKRAFCYPMNKLTLEWITEGGEPNGP